MGKYKIETLTIKSDKEFTFDELSFLKALHTTVNFFNKTEKVGYCMDYNECSNTDLEKTFELLLCTAVKNKLAQSDMPDRLFIISDMEFDCCAENAGMTNFENAKVRFESFGYRLPQIVFWNVASRNIQQPVGMNEQGVVLVSGCSPQIFSMIKGDKLDPYSFMMEVLSSERYSKIAA